MTFIEYFKQQFIEEGETTRKMLSRIPDDQFGYIPHPKSMNIKSLATHIADLPGWIHMTFTTDELDFAIPYEQPEINNTADLMAYFEKRYQEGLSTLVPENEALLDKPWTLRNAEIIYLTDHLKSNTCYVEEKQGWRNLTGNLNNKAGVHLLALNYGSPFGRWLLQ